MSVLLARHWFLLVLFGGVGIAMAFPNALRPLTNYWEPRWAVGFALFLMAWTMPTRSLVTELKQPYASLWAVFLSYGLVPASAWLAGLLTPHDDVRIGIILISCVPCTLSSAILWTRMAGGNEATALLTVLGTTVTSWFLTTGWIVLLTGSIIDLDVAAMMLDLVLTLIVPVFVGQALRLIPLGVKIAERHATPIGVLSQCCILAIVLKAGVMVGDKLHAGAAWEAPAIFVWSIALAIPLHLFALAAGIMSSRWLGFERGRQVAVAFASSQKTLQVAIVLYDQYFGERFPFAVLPLLFYHVGQLLLDTLIARRLRSSSLARRAQSPDS